MMELTQQTILILFAALAAAIFILFILCIVLFVKLNGQKKQTEKQSKNLDLRLKTC